VKRILILDDVKQYVDALARAFSDNYEVVKAFSLKQAKEVMDDTVSLALVDLVLSDSDYANRDGIEFLKWAKKEYPRCLIIMMSAHRDYDAAVESVNLGASHYIKKPINLIELQKLISGLLRTEKND
jgi:two-component system response regulator AtoC